MSRAVVIGGSIAGMCSARVLCDHRVLVHTGKQRLRDRVIGPPAIPDAPPLPS